MTDLAKLVVKLEAQTAQYQAGLERAQKQLAKFNRESSISAANIAKGIGAAATAAAAAIAYMGKAAIDNADRLNLLSQSTGVSTEALSQLEYAAQMSGVESETLSKSLAKLSKTALSAAKEGGAAADVFEQLGIKVQNADGTMRPTEDLLLDIADKFSKMKDGVAKTGLAMELFGRSGAQLIPFLNEGKAGIAALTAEAERLGLTVSGEAAAAADEFNDNLDRMKGAAKGVVNQAVQQFLPTLVALSESFVKSAQSGGGLSAAVSILVGVFKTLVTAGILVRSVFERVGRVIYGVGAAVVAVAQGEFKLAKEEIQDAFNDAAQTVVEDAELIKKVWADTVPVVADTAKEIDDTLEDTVIFNPDKAKDKADKSAQAALESLQSLTQGLEQQVATYGMAEEAVMRYRVTQGDLAATIAEAGPGAEAYKEKLVALTAEMAALEEATRMQEELLADENRRKEEGRAVTEALRTETEIYAETLRKLNELHDMGNISTETYTRGLEKAKETLEESTKKNNEFLDQASRNVQDIIAENLSNGFEDGAKGMLRSFAEMLKQMAIQAIAAQIAQKIFGTGGVGGGGGWIGGLMNIASSYFGGTRDAGGPGMAGTAYMIGTGAQPEMFVPDQPGKFVPADQWMGNSKPTVNLRNVNAFDTSVIRDYLLSAAGEEVFLNVMDRNGSRVRAAASR